MKTGLYAVILAGAAAAAVASESEDSGLKWVTDFEQASTQARERNVPILADFSGSDWCGWCIKLDNEVFSTEEFARWAKSNVVLFVADFPARKELPEKEAEQNKKLAKKYGVLGFPTVLLIDSSGEVLAKTGYRPGGPESYVEHLKQLMDNKTEGGS